VAFTAFGFSVVLIGTPYRGIRRHVRGHPL
jgi:hypothetical protein